MELKDQLTALQGELKSYVDKAADERKEHGTILADTKSTIEKLQAQVDAIDIKLASKHSAEKQKSLSDTLKESDSVSHLMKHKRGTSVLSLKSADLMEHKTVITSTAVGASTSGVLSIDRVPGIVAEARQTLKLRDLFTSRPTTMQLVDFIKVNAPLSAASVVVEGNLKPENAVTFSTVSEKVRTIATIMPATKQVLDDFTELAGFLQDSLPYYVDLAEEQELLAGDGTGEHLHGFISQASAYNTAANATGDNKIDTIGKAISQIAVAKELSPNFVVLNEADWWKIRLTKDGYGRYILGDPQANVSPSLFGLDVVATTSIASNSFLVGSSAAPAAEIRDRMEMQVEISTEHADYFARNMVAIRAEKRVALLVKRPNAFVTGTFPVAA